MREVASLLGLVSNLALTTSWARYTYIALQHATFLAIKFNTHTVFSSDKFHRLTELLRSTIITARNFYLAKAHKTVWDERKPFFITTAMRAEIALLTTIISSPTTFLWETPIRHVISTTYDYTVPGDACLTGAGAYCDELGFWYYIEWPKSVEQRTLRHINNKSSQLITINSLEYATIILSYNAVLDALDLLKVNPPPHPKALIKCDNTTADTWTRKIATSSATGKRLNRLFCSLLINQSLGIDSAFLPGRENIVADNISRLKRSLTSLNALLQKHPFLASYRRYHPPHELCSKIYNCLTNISEALPGPLRMKGHFTHAKANI